MWLHPQASTRYSVVPIRYAVDSQAPKGQLRPETKFHAAQKSFETGLPYSHVSKWAIPYGSSTWVMSNFSFAPFGLLFVVVADCELF